MSTIAEIKEAVPPKRYARESYSHCPNCGADDIEGRHVEIDSQIAWQDVSCSVCEASWRDTYALTGYINPENFTKPIPEEGIRIEVYQDEINDSPFDDTDQWEFHPMKRGFTGHEEYIKDVRNGEPVFTSKKYEEMYKNKQIFICSAYSHSGEQWGLFREVHQCQFDTANFAGILIYKDDPQDYAGAENDREKWARGIMRQYTQYLGGEVFGYTIYKDNEPEHACGGFYGDMDENGMPESIAEDLNSMGFVPEFEVKDPNNMGFCEETLRQKIEKAR